MKALLIKETGTDKIIKFLENNGYKVIHYSKIENIELELNEVLDPEEIGIIIIDSIFLFNAFLRYQEKELPKIKKYHGKSAGLRFLERNLPHFQHWIDKESIIVLGCRNYNHGKWAKEMNVKFVHFTEQYPLQNQIISLLSKRMKTNQKMEEIMEKGTIVQVRCTKCRTSLVNQEKTVAGSPAIHFKAIEKGNDGEKKDIYLSAKFGDFRKSGHKFPKGTVVQLFCPHCGKEFEPNHINCATCDEKLIILCAENGTMNMLGVCPTVGCHNHKSNIELPTKPPTASP